MGRSTTACYKCGALSVHRVSSNFQPGREHIRLRWAGWREELQEQELPSVAGVRRWAPVPRFDNMLRASVL